MFKLSKMIHHCKHLRESQVQLIFLKSLLFMDITVFPNCFLHRPSTPGPLNCRIHPSAGRRWINLKQLVLELMNISLLVWMTSEQSSMFWKEPNSLWYQIKTNISFLLQMVQIKCACILSEGCFFILTARIIYVTSFEGSASQDGHEEKWTRTVSAGWVTVLIPDSKGFFFLFFFLGRGFLAAYLSVSICSLRTDDAPAWHTLTGLQRRERGAETGRGCREDGAGGGQWKGKSSKRCYRWRSVTAGKGVQLGWMWCCCGCFGWEDRTDPRRWPPGATRVKRYSEEVGQVPGEREREKEREG